MLLEVAARLSATVRGHDYVARLGGDEFAVVLQDVERSDAAARVAEKIVEALGRPFAVNGGTAAIGCSVGIALFPSDADSSERLMEVADAAMYAVTSNGGERTAFSSPRG